MRECYNYQNREAGLFKSFTPHTQDQLRALHIKQDERYLVEYANKDYFNGEELIERSEGIAVVSSDGNIYFNVTDPYGMDKLVLNARVIM